jgi:ABC-type transporter Mla subunit MlaD
LNLESLIAQLEKQRDRLDQAMSALSGGRTQAKGLRSSGGKKGPRHLSAAARRKISEAQKQRWAKRKGKS